MYPGWTASTPDGTSVPIQEADLCYMLVMAAPAVDGRIVFEYYPSHFTSYAIAAVIALLASATIVAFPRKFLPLTVPVAPGVRSPRIHATAG